MKSFTNILYRSEIFNRPKPRTLFCSEHILHTTFTTVRNSRHSSALNFTLVLLLLLLSNFAFAQKIVDYIEHKSGTIVKGEILNKEYPDSTSIKTKEGIIITYYDRDIVDKGTYDESPQPENIKPGYKPFLINSTFKKSTYDGKEFRKMKHRQFKEIIMTSNIKEAQIHYRASQTLRTVSSTLNTIGLLVVGVGSFLYTNDESTGLQVQLGGLGVSLVGFFVSLPARAAFKKSLVAYNKGISISLRNVESKGTPYANGGRGLMLSIGF